MVAKSGAALLATAVQEISTAVLVISAPPTALVGFTTAWSAVVVRVTTSLGHDGIGDGGGDLT